jgi:hypothetical protein
MTTDFIKSHPCTQVDTQSSVYRYAMSVGKRKKHLSGCTESKILKQRSFIREWGGGEGHFWYGVGNSTEIIILENSLYCIYNSDIHGMRHFGLIV